MRLTVDDQGETVSRFTITIADQSEAVMSDAARQCMGGPTTRQSVPATTARQCSVAPAPRAPGHDLAPLA